MVLVDSGIQCAGGTTDATRTVILGNPEQKQKRIYTLVLKAHIQLAKQVFPEGTNGTALMQLHAHVCGMQVWISVTEQAMAWVLF